MIFDFKVVTEWFDNLLNGFMPAWATTVVECVLIGVGLLVVYALLALFYIYFERKVCGAFQCRLGPNRVGPLGLLQSFADMFKILIKELIPLNNIDKFLFNLAPFLVIVASFAAFAVLPWGKGLQIIQYRHLLPDRRFIDRSARHSARRMVVKQQVYAYRRTSKRRADDQL